MSKLKKKYQKNRTAQIKSIIKYLKNIPHEILNTVKHIETTETVLKTNLKGQALIPCLKTVNDRISEVVFYGLGTTQEKVVLCLLFKWILRDSSILLIIQHVHSKANSSIDN